MLKTKLVLLIVALQIVAFYQGCGSSEHSKMANSSFNVLKEDPQPFLNEEETIQSLQAKSLIAVESDLVFRGLPIDEDDIDYMFWTHKLNDMQFCNLGEVESSSQILLNCDEAGNLQLYFFVQYKDGDLVTFSASVEIFSEPQQPIIEEPEPGGPDGKQLFSLSCAGCHSQSDKAGRSASQIQSAIDRNVGGMGALSSLSSEEVQAISDYLNE
jgi:hypothetical protein